MNIVEQVNQQQNRCYDQWPECTTNARKPELTDCGIDFNILNSLENVYDCTIEYIYQFRREALTVYGFPTEKAARVQAFKRVWTIIQNETDASLAMYRQRFEHHCRQRGIIKPEYDYSTGGTPSIRNYKCTVRFSVINDRGMDLIHTCSSGYRTCYTNARTEACKLACDLIEQTSAINSN